MRDSMPFIDLRAQYDVLREQVQQRLHAVLEHGQYVMGPEVAELERRLAEHVGGRHCSAASSGTDTLLMAIMALGVGPNDVDVIVEYCDTHRIGAVIPLFDIDLPVLAAHAARFEAVCARLVCSPSRVVDVCNDNGGPLASCNDTASTPPEPTCRSQALGSRSRAAN